MIMRKLIVLLVLIFTVNAAWAVEEDVYQLLDEALRSGRVKHVGFDRAFKELKPLAEEGDAKAMFHISVLYYLGVGGAPRDAEKAKQLIVDSAEKGYPLAEYQLGNNYERGVYGTVDYSLALEWYTRAANAGMCGAVKRLINAYDKGEMGLPKDGDMVAKWSKKAEACTE
jgi:TPR repeat protein